MNHISFVEGLRALSILWTICFHVVFFGGYQVTERQYGDWLKHPLIGALAKGNLGVDVFFVISGYLIARPLLSELYGHDGVRLGRFYFRRLMRIFPAYLVTLWIGTRFWGSDSHGENAWANLLLINNFLTFDQQALGWTWSLAVEEQFYVLFPLFLVAARRLIDHGIWVRGSLVAFWAFLAALLLRGVLVFHADTDWIQQPEPFHPRFDAAHFRVYFDSIYDKIYGHGGGIICGVGVACCERDTALLRRLSQRRTLSIGLLLAAFSGLGFQIFGEALPRTSLLAPSLRASLSVMFDTYLFALMTSYVLLYMLAVRAAGHTCMLDRMLSWRGFRPIAKLSYSAYLLHPMVVLLLWSRVNWDLASAGAIMILEHAGLSIIVTHLAALILYLLVERPLHRLGRRLTR